MQKLRSTTQTSTEVRDEAYNRGTPSNVWTRVFQIYLISVSVFALTGCALVEGIFKAGFWVGTIIVLAIVGLVLWGVSVFVRR